MYKKIISLIIIFVCLFTPFLKINAETLSQRLSGRILLQVEQNGEAWFVSPDNQERHFLGRPADAFQVMRELGLGISNADFERFKNTMPDKLLGKILLKVEDNGKAFYVYPVDKKPYFLGRPADAFQVMRELGLGITDLSLNEVVENEASQTRRVEQEKNEENKNQTSDKETEEQEKEIASSTEDNANSTATSTEEIGTSTVEIIIPVGSAACEFLAEYYKKETISGVANYSETVVGIDYDWGAESPELLGGFNNKFAVRYTGDCYFEEGTYEFSSTFNDGIEATLDNFWLAKSWKNRNIAASNSVTLNITEGYHRIKVEYYDHLGDAGVKLDWIKQE